MEIRRLVSTLVLAGILSIGTSAQTVSGRVTGIAVDPSETSSNTIYVSTAGSGVWRSIVTTVMLLF